MLVGDEYLEGDNAYFCEKCQKKVDTTKRCCFVRDALPQTLVSTVGMGGGEREGEREGARRWSS